MYLMYADESGDSGLSGSPTRYFALSGLVIHESRWRDFVNQMLAFRKTLKAVYGLPLRVEIHASVYVRSPPMPGLAKYQRLAILRNLLDEVARMNFISVTNVVVDKLGKPPGYDVFTSAWQALFQRFENTLRYGNFPGGHRDDYGLIFTDNTDGKKLQRLVRKMAVHNPVPNKFGPGYRNLPIVKVIEDPHSKDSSTSLFLQAADSAAYFLTQHFQANQYIRRQGAQHYLGRLRPVLNLRASSSHPMGVVLL